MELEMRANKSNMLLGKSNHEVTTAFQSGTKSQGKMKVPKFPRTETRGSTEQQMYRNHRHQQQALKSIISNPGSFLRDLKHYNTNTHTSPSSFVQRRNIKTAGHSMGVRQFR